MSIKLNIGKLSLPVDLDGFMTLAAEKQIETSPIQEKVLILLTSLPRHHRDPFDRLLIAQSFSTGIPLISADLKFDEYQVVRYW